MQHEEEHRAEASQAAITVLSPEKANVGTWDPHFIRDQAGLAFDIFDSNGDGSISVAELTFTSRANTPKGSGLKRNPHAAFAPKSILDEMRIFHYFGACGVSITYYLLTDT